MRRACPRGSTGTSRARRFAAVEGAAQRARVPPVDYVDKPSRRRATPTRGPVLVARVQLRMSLDTPPLRRAQIALRSAIGSP